jgi:hypothetical protein
MACCFSVAAWAAPAECADSENAGKDLSFQRILVPEGRVKDWPTHDEKYFPLDQAEFQRLLSIARSGDSETPAASFARVTKATYRVRLAAERLLEGHADVDVVLPEGNASFLSLDPCNLALKEAFWSSPEAPADMPRKRAVIGTAASGKTLVRVERSGHLQWEWSLAGYRDAAEVTSFLLDLPRCAINELYLDLPEGITPAIDVGLVLRHEPAENAMTRWCIELGGHQQVHLRLSQPGEASPRTLLALMRESCIYDLSIRGVEISAQWRIQAHNEPLQKIQILLDPGMQLVTAYCGDTPVAWTMSPASEGKPTCAVLTLPEPIQDTERVLRLGALAPLVLDRPWRLPRIRAEGLAWQEGGITLLTPEPLVVQQLSLTGCTQKGTEPLALPRIGESMTFQCFDSSAALEITLARRNATVQVLMATEVTLSKEEIVARVAGDFRLSEGAEPLLEGEVAENWTIDAVQSAPAGAVADWQFEPKPKESGTLAVRLAKALAPARPVRLVITARQTNASVSQTFRLGQLSPVRFSDVIRVKHLVSLRADGPYDVKCSEIERLKRHSMEKLSAAEIDLFALPPRELLFEKNDSSDNIQVALAARKPKYSGAIQMQAVVGDHVMQEGYVFRCVPESDPIDHVLLRFYPRRDTAPKWTLDGEEGSKISARLLSNEEQALAGLDASAEVWEISLEHPRNTPFGITASREVNCEGRQPLSLAAMPEAVTQRGTVEIFGQGTKTLQIENLRLEPVPPESHSADPLRSLQGTYHYDPQRDAISGSEAAICVTGIAEATTPNAWIWMSRLESWYEASGAVRHMVAFEMQNMGRSQFVMRLPPGTRPDEVRGVWIDDKAAIWSRMDSGDSLGILVTVPADRRFSVVRVEWTASVKKLGLLGKLTPPSISAELPILASHWTLWTPPDYDLSGSHSNWQEPRFVDYSWSQRLFGVLGRSNATAAFNPFSLQDWWALLAPASSYGDPQAVKDQSPTTGVSEDMQGWNACCVELTSSTPAILYVHRDTIRLYAAIAFWLALVLGHWLIVPRPILTIASLGLLAMGSCLLPTFLVSVSSSAFVGLLLCVTIRWIRGPKTLPPQSSSSQTLPSQTLPSQSSAKTSITPLSHVTPTSSILGMLFLALCMHGAMPRDARGEPSNNNSTTPYRVLVPMGANLAPSGDKVFVPEPFYRELSQKAASATEPCPGSLIVSAAYRGELTRESVSGRLMIGNLKALYDVDVLANATRVRIPLRAGGMVGPRAEVMLDGRTVPAEWDSHAGVLSVDVVHAGLCRIEIPLHPTSPSNGVQAGLDLAIPRVAHSQLELTLPDDAPTIEVPSAIGTVRLDETPSRVCADLGPVDRLVIRWKEKGEANRGTPTTNVEQYMWLKILPGSVVVDAKFKLRVVEGQVQQMRLIVDPRLRLLPMQGSDAPVVAVRPGPRQTKILTFQWPRPLSGETTLDTSFLWTETSGVGNFRLPQLDVIDERTFIDDLNPTASASSDTRIAVSSSELDRRDVPVLSGQKRWFAVTVDPTLDGVERFSEGVEESVTPEFLKAWGPTDIKPQSAYRLALGDRRWSLSTRPHEANTTSTESLSLSFDRNDVELDFNAQLVTTAGYVFQYRVATAEKIKIDRVSLIEENVERVARWSQDAGGTITVFLSGPVNGQQRFSLHGRLAVSVGENWTVPHMHLEQCQLRSSRVLLFRRPAVQLTWQCHGVSVQPPNPAVSSWTAQGRFVTGFGVDDPVNSQIAVTVKPNEPHVKAQQVTSIQGSGRSWTAKIHGVVEVRDGVLDQLRLRIPDFWKGPFTASIPGTLSTADLPGEGRQLVFQPNAPMQGDLDFSISGSLEFARGDRPSVPDVAILNIDALQRWVALPDHSEDQPMNWQVRGLRHCDKDHQPSIPPEPGCSLYSVVGKTMQAVLLSSKQSPNAMVVHMADISMAWQADGTCRGVALYDLEPGGAVECPLSLPEGLELVQVLIDDSPAAAIAAGHNMWRVALSSKRLPQRIEVVFSGTIQPSDRTNERLLLAPALGDVPIQQTLWTVTPPALFALSIPPQGISSENNNMEGKEGNTREGNITEGSVVADWQQQWIRTRNNAAIVSTACQALEADGDEIARWYPLWMRRLTMVRSVLQREIAQLGVPESTRGVSMELKALDDEQLKIAERLEMADTYKELSSVESTADASVESWKHSTDGLGAPVCYVGGGNTSLTIQYRRVAGDEWSRRLGMVFALGGLAVCVAIGWRRGIIPHCLREWPHGVLMILGIAWWLWLWPSILGLLITLGGLVAVARRFPWPNR